MKDRVELPPGEESRFVREWLTAAESVRRRKGFISMELYQNRKRKTSGYVSVLVWKSLEELDRALGAERFLRGQDAYQSG